MTPVRMVHPLHGATHAYDQGEVERLKGYGWQPEEAPELVKLPVLEEPPKRKPGRPKKGE